DLDHQGADVVDLGGDGLEGRAGLADQAHAVLDLGAGAVDQGLDLLGGLGRTLLAIGGSDADREALNVLERARRADPGDASMMRSLAVAYDRAGDRGMATLLTAERYAVTGRREDALLHAKRATRILPDGSPGWLRAQDILALKKE
ncbi:MAG: hypothetical protein AAF074_02740, partial [Pseudomonadota bacterium]